LKVINQFLFSLLHLLFVFVQFPPQKYLLIFIKKNFFVLIFDLNGKNDNFLISFFVILLQLCIIIDRYAVK